MKRILVVIWTVACAAGLAVSARVSADASAGPTPTPTPASRSRVASPKPTSDTPTYVPYARPTATPTPSPTPQAQGIATLEALQSRIRERINDPQFRRARIGIKIVSLNTGSVLFENDAEKYFTPASNMKNFTVAAALERLGPDFKFVTSIDSQTPDANGTVKGDLRIIGRGDITISTAFFGTTPTDPETYYKGVDRLADRIAAAGIKRVEGDLVGDERYFKGFAVPPTWEWDDLQGKDGSEVSALPINDNDVDLSIKPGRDLAAPCFVTISPPNSLYKILNECRTTTQSGAKRQLEVVKSLDQNVLRVSGSMPVDDKGFSQVLAFSHPADLFLGLLRASLAKRGILVTGRDTATGDAGYHDNVTTIGAGPVGSSVSSEPPGWARLESPPFSVIAAKTMKPSQNMYAETILWALGEQTRPAPEITLAGPAPAVMTSAELGLAAAKKFRDQIGIPADAVLQYDGSGMSRHDEITPSAVVQLYTYMAKQSRYAQVWRDSLSIGGVDGTLRNRFKGTAAQANMRGKTGTLDQVSALAGYVTTAGGEQLVVSILVNGVPGPSSIRTGLMDKIVVDLADFRGAVDPSH